MIRSTLATLTVSMAVATVFAQSTDKSCQSSTVKKPSAAISSSRLIPAVLHAKPSAGTTIPRKPRAVLPPVTNALFGPKPAPPALVVPSTLPATAALIVPPIAPLIVPHPRDVSVHPNLEFVPNVQRGGSRHAPASAIYVDYPCWRICQFARCGSANPIRSRTQG